MVVTPTPDSDRDSRRTPGRVLNPRRLLVGYLATDVVAAALNFAGVVIVLRSLSVEEFGVADLLRVGLWFIASLTSLNIFESALRFYFDATDEDTRRRILGGALRIYVVAGGLAALVFGAVAYLTGPWFGTPLTPAAIFYAALTIPVTNLALALTRTAVIQGRSTVYGVLVIWQPFVLLFAAWLLVLVLDRGLEGYFLALFAAAGSTALVGYFLLPGQYYWGRLQGRVRDYLSFGAPSTVTEMIQYGFGVFVRVLLARWAPGTALGWYAFAERIQAPLQMVVAAVGRVWVPWLLQDRTRPNQEVRDEARHLSAFVLLAVGVLVIFLPELIDLLGGARYQGAYRIVLLVLLARLLMFFGDYLLSASLTIAKRTHHRIWIYLVSYGAAAAVAVLALPRIGVVAIGLAAVVASGLILCGMWWASRLVYPLEEGVVAVILGCIPALVIAYYASEIGFTPAKLGLFALYLVALWVLRLLPLPFYAMRRPAE